MIYTTRIRESQGFRFAWLAQLIGSAPQLPREELLNGGSVKTAKITIKNYRGFGDQEPVAFEIGQGFTAFLGKNNAGKSTAKLIFYELRQLFATLLQMNPSQSPGFCSLLQGAQCHVSYAGVSDPEELFNNTNDRPITVEIALLVPSLIASQTSPPTDTLRKVVLKAERAAPEAPPAERRAAFAETCRKLEIPVCVTERRALENYFTDAAVKSAFGNAFSALQPFQALKDAQNSWSKSDNWKVARQITLAELAGTDLGNFLGEI